MASAERDDLLTVEGPPDRTEQRLYDLAQLSPDAILVNRGDRIEFANEAAVALFGVASTAELLGRSPFLWFHEEDHAKVRGRIRHLLGGGAPLPRSMLTIVRADGTTRRAEGVASAFHDDRGPALQVVLRDVTDQERAERELRAAHARLGDILESITDAFYAVDAQWRLTYVNRRTEASWHRTREALVGQSLWTLFPDDPANEGVAALREAMATRLPGHLETFSAYLGRWIETFIYPSADGGLSVFFQDITDRKAAEDRLRLFTEALPQLVWSADAGGRLDYFNQRWRDYTGQAPGAEAWEPALHPEDRDGVVALWQGAVRRKANFELEHRLRRADGEYRWYLRRAFAVRAPDGGLHRWFGTCTDIHDLKTSQELLRQADRLKEDFIHMASHEFRTPLTALRLQVELVRRGVRHGGPPQRLEQQLAAVDGQIDRLQSLLGTLLDVSRVSAGKLTLDLREVDLAEVVHDAVGRLEAEAASRATTIQVSAEAAAGQWDRSRLDQVATNLLTNALKYGGGKPVAVEVLARDDEAVLRVRDQGIGIAPEDLSKVFNEFERAGNATPFAGLGLGLWIVRNLVAAHGGEVTVESAVGQGSTFTVRLPRRPPP